MDKKYHALTISIANRNLAYKNVTELLHSVADSIVLRVGYPLPDKDISIIFLMLRVTNDEIGSITGKLGQLESVKVKSMTLKVD
ncbi:MAG: iron-only hydrogenase system regulator [Bacteroidetes bacterium]|nr:iron-only hydrogenase system regulator [Bacteroidota bacterium]